MRRICRQLRAPASRTGPCYRIPNRSCTPLSLPRSRSSANWRPLLAFRTAGMRPHPARPGRTAISRMPALAGDTSTTSSCRFPAPACVHYRRSIGGSKNAATRWRIYFHDLPQAATLAELWLKIPTHFSLFEDEFAEDARSGRLPNYSFIEPRYFASRWTHKVPNDQHPPHNILYGEQLIASVYNAVRNAPTWQRTLLIVVYDEHGGCYRSRAASRCGIAGRSLRCRVRVRPLWRPRACGADLALCRAGQHH